MPDLAELQHTKSVLEREHGSIIASIHELRQRARQKSIEAAATRTPLPESEIQYWKTNIAKNQSELMETQSKLAAVNKAIREAKAMDAKPAKDPGSREQSHSAPQIDEDLFYNFFHQIVCDSVDPRMYEAFVSGAKALQADYRKMHGGSDA